MGLPFGLHQGIRIAVTRCSTMMIRNFDLSRPMSAMSGPSPTHLLVLTLWSMRSVFTSSMDMRRFIPCMSSLPNGSQFRPFELESNDSLTFQESAPIQAHYPSISESVVKANWLSVLRLPMPSSSARP